MSKNNSTETINLLPFDNHRLNSLCGNFNENLQHIEQQLSVEIALRGNKFKITGDVNNVKKVKLLIETLYEETANNKELSINTIQHYLHQLSHNKSNDYAKLQQCSIKVPTSTITPKTQNQIKYIKNIAKYAITFGVGPAGTGKTFLAAGAAVESLEKNQSKRIILVRPVVEAGENLGFLPGDLTQKIDPYLRPLYDALYEMLGFEKVNKYLNQGIIEVAPLAYMRGRTLNDAFIILDESQNTTKEQMKMFLTRIGFSSKVVITGDITQVDLPKNKISGLTHAIKVLENIEKINFNFFETKDVIRHPLVQDIINAYEKAESKRVQ